MPTGQSSGSNLLKSRGLCDMVGISQGLARPGDDRIVGSPRRPVGFAGRRAIMPVAMRRPTAPSVAGSEVIVMTATSPIERVVLTHLQIPLKEPFRISGGEVAIKDAILVTVETVVGHRPGGELAHGRELRLLGRHAGRLLGRSRRARSLPA